MPIFNTLNLGWNRFGGKIVCLGEQERGDEVACQNKMMEDRRKVIKSLNIVYFLIIE